MRKKNSGGKIYLAPVDGKIRHHSSLLLPAYYLFSIVHVCADIFLSLQVRREYAVLTY